MNTKVMRDISPAGRQVKSMQARDDMKMHVILGELIANSIDANARLIELSRTDKRIIIKDDGDGCPDLQMMLRLGESGSAAYRGKIGRYGQGFTNSAVRLGTVVRVDSYVRAGDYGHAAVVDFNAIIEKNKWVAEFRDGECRRTHSGTTIEVTNLINKRMMAGWSKQAPEIIARLFSAAIDAGVVIKVDGAEVVAIPFPELKHEVHVKGELGGRAFEMTAGLFKDPKTASMPSGFDVRWGAMSIKTGATDYGFGNYPSSGFYARVVLSDTDKASWTLATHKDDIEERPDLQECAAVQKAIVPLLERLREEGRNLTMEIPSTFLADFFKELKRKARVVDLDEQVETAKSAGTEERTGRDGGDAPGVKGADGTGGDLKPKIEISPLGNREEDLPVAMRLQVRPHTQKDVHGLGFVEEQHPDAMTLLLVVNLYNGSEPAASLWKNGAFVHYALGVFAKWLAWRISENDKRFRFIAKALELDDNIELAESKVWLYVMERSSDLKLEEIRPAAASVS